MSLLQQAVAQVSHLRRQLDDQEVLISGFLRRNSEQMRQVRDALSGSNTGYDRRMMTALQQADDSLKKSLQQVRRAKDALFRIEQL
ncbi:hypothetical protein GZ998_03195 [Actinomyces sp. 594]|uniref:hypothetical protein n=1 Tax=Actinomyces sp. 594 TaxID=2057793 RepID=UPI001C571B75|nr:hypothetical protein [Actinomyces sp. 594]MBW3068519.1 hypothetical protein [Actinomyces sp. 594]